MNQEIKPTKTLLLIDANSLIHRCFHALPPFTASDGRPTGALYGLANILLKIFREEKPDYAAALFDRPEPTFREEIYPKYKAQRPKAPDELISQIIEAHNLFQNFGIKTLEKPGAEADDLIATLAEKFGREQDLKIIILTSDSDTLQLVKGENVNVRILKKGISDTVIYDEKEVENRYGLKPKQLIDYKVLVGDASDNIRGVNGIGPKTAAKLLQKFGGLEEIYRNLDKTGLEKKLADAEKQVEISKELIRLKINIDLGIRGITELEVAENGDKLKRYFAGLGFKKILERLGENKSEGELSSRQGNFFN